MKLVKMYDSFIKKNFRLILNSSFYMMISSIFLIISVLISYYCKFNLTDKLVIEISVIISIITFLISVISEKIFSKDFGTVNLIFISPLKRIKSSFYNLMTYIFVSFSSIFSVLFEIGDRPCNVYSMISILLIAVIPLLVVFYIRYKKTASKMIKKVYSEIKIYEKKHNIDKHLSRDRVVYVIKEHINKVEVAKEFINHDKVNICNSFEAVIIIYIYKLLDEYENEHLDNIDTPKSIYIKHF